MLRRVRGKEPSKMNRVRRRYNIIDSSCIPLQTNEMFGRLSEDRESSEIGVRCETRNRLGRSATTKTYTISRTSRGRAF